MTRYIFLTGALACAIPASQACAQGCSDAGFCSVGTLRHNPVDSTNRTRLQFTFPLGTGDENVNIFAPAVQLDHQVNDHWAIQGKITGNYASGNLGSAVGAGDLYFAGIYAVPLTGNWKASLLVAWKFPLNGSSLSSHGMDLPMVYQSSLGTVDVISGLSLTNDALGFSVGMQHPLSGPNRNNFSPGDWDTPEAEAYPKTNRFDRKSDVLFRVTYTARLRPGLALQGGLLNIYHVADDTYLDESGPTSRRQVISGSKGITVNLSGTAWITLGSGLRAGLTAAMPLAARDVRPDGLTRFFIVAPELQWNIGR